MDDEIAAAILSLIEKQKLVSEGAGATAVAAAMFGKLPLEGKKVVCLVSGGNIDVKHPEPHNQPWPCQERTCMPARTGVAGQARHTMFL